jgi:hypothetical protein
VTMRWAGLIALLAVVGCHGNAEWVREPVNPLGPTLKIVNNTSLEYRVTVSPAQLVMARPGQTTCVRVSNLNQLRIIEVFALASSTPYYTPEENLMNAPGWILEIGQLPRYDVLSLRPAEPCMR